MLRAYVLFRIWNTLRELVGEASLREIARKTKVSPSSAKQWIDFLFQQGMLAKRTVGTAHQYRLDSGNALTRQAKVLTTISELNQGIQQLRKHPILSLVLYGSSATGEDDAKSDIDLLAIVSKRSEIHINSTSSREVSLLQFTSSEWRRQANENKVFYEQVVFKGVVLLGERPVV
ncbi:MAG: nucleotidyltransferase domain-containing protein [Candidatus Woesearchaeota archaeon]|nr:nucleotidyltransferase domain-containing protein [Candidatus Woesearchaeota archaeon]